MENINFFAESEALAMEVARLEWVIIQEITNDPDWLTGDIETIFRWNLSLARLTTIIDSNDSGKQTIVTKTMDSLRQELLHLFKNFANTERVFDKIGLASIHKELFRLGAIAHKRLLDQHPDVSPQALISSVEKRPLVIALSGGGGCAYVFCGALALLDQEALYPSAMAGNSMGAIIAAFRALSPKFQLDKMRSFVEKTSHNRLFYRAMKFDSQFTFPAPLEMHLHAIIGAEFERNGKSMTLNDPHLPLRTVVAGVGAPRNKSKLAYAKLQRSPTSVNIGIGTVLSKLRHLATMNFQAIYLGADDFSRQISILDAVGLSASIPGIIYHDAAVNDAKMATKLQLLVEKNEVKLLVDGGFADNLPSEQAKLAIQQSSQPYRDPFVLALDCFSPNMRHFFFLPAMYFVEQKSLHGHAHAHCVIKYRSVLSPLKILPSAKDFESACSSGIMETLPYIPALKKILSTIKNPYQHAVFFK